MILLCDTSSIHTNRITIIILFRLSDYISTCIDIKSDEKLLFRILNIHANETRRFVNYYFIGTRKDIVHTRAHTYLCVVRFL